MPPGSGSHRTAQRVPHPTPCKIKAREPAAPGRFCRPDTSSPAESAGSMLEQGQNRYHARFGTGAAAWPGICGGPRNGHALPQPPGLPGSGLIPGHPPVPARHGSGARVRRPRRPGLEPRPPSDFGPSAGEAGGDPPGRYHARPRAIRRRCTSGQPARHQRSGTTRRPACRHIWPPGGPSGCPAAGWDTKASTIGTAQPKGRPRHIDPARRTFAHGPWPKPGSRGGSTLSPEAGARAWAAGAGHAQASPSDDTGHNASHADTRGSVTSQSKS